MISGEDEFNVNGLSDFDFCQKFNVGDIVWVFDECENELVKKVVSDD